MGQYTQTGPFSRQTWQTIENIPGAILGGLRNVASYLGSEQASRDYTQLLRGQLPNRAGSAQQTGMYGRYAPAAVPGTQTPTVAPGGNQAAAQRSYQQEASRVAQLTAQDPELQRYEAARQKAVASGATPETVQSAEDIGMQIWAARHGGLAKQVKPGQSGYEAIQSQLNAGQMGAPLELGAFANAQPTDLLFNPSSPLGAPPQTGKIDYTQVVPAALGGTLGIGGSYFNSPQQAQLFSRFQQAAPAQTGMNPGLAPGSPYAEAAAAGSASYAGATGIQPVGSSLTGGADSFASQKAQQQAEEFKKRLLSTQQ